MFNIRIILRIFFLLLFLISAWINYEKNVIRGDFEVLTNPDGPDTSDYIFE